MSAGLTINFGKQRNFFGTDCSSPLPPANSDIASSKEPKSKSTSALSELSPSKSANAPSKLSPSKSANAPSKVSPSKSANAPSKLLQSQGTSASSKLPPSKSTSAGTKYPQSNRCDITTPASSQICISKAPPLRGRKRSLDLDDGRKRGPPIGQSSTSSLKCLQSEASTGSTTSPKVAKNSDHNRSDQIRTAKMALTRKVLKSKTKINQKPAIPQRVISEEEPEKQFSNLQINPHLGNARFPKIAKNIHHNLNDESNTTKVGLARKVLKSKVKINQKTARSQAVFSEEEPEKPFSNLRINSRLVSNLAKSGISSMTKIQEMAIPSILNGKDCLVRAETGSGKTLTYALPIISNLMERTPKLSRKDGIHVLIVVPTRELALQTLQCLEKLCKACVWVVPSHLIGGEKKKSEKARIRKGVNILVATPGRLLDHFDTTNCLSMAKLEYLVLDEADRMLEMGYEQSMKSIIMEIKKQQAMCPISRQSLLLSATLTTAVEKLANVSMRNPETIDVTKKEDDAENLSSDTLATPENLNQYFMVVPTKSRLTTLSAFILHKCRIVDEKKLLVFFPCQDMVDYHSAVFIYILARYGRLVQSSLEKRAQNVLSGEQDSGQEEDIDDLAEMEDEDSQDDGDAIRFFKLHGSMSQEERTAVFREFSKAPAGVLLCTDVASRGLDLPKVDWIIQYNGACTAPLYVHRVGRTARAHMSGNAVVFLTPDEWNYVNMLEEKGITLQEIHMESILMILTDRRLHENLHPRQIPRTKEEATTNLQMKYEDLLVRNREFETMASTAFISFIRSYASFPKEARDVFKFHELHLGHVAKSFGLRKTPTEIGKVFTKRHRNADTLRELQETRFKVAKDRIVGKNDRKDNFRDKSNKGPRGKSNKGVRGKSNKGVRGKSSKGPPGKSSKGPLRRIHPTSKGVFKKKIYKIKKKKNSK